MSVRLFVLLGALVIAGAWGLYWLVESKIGPPPPCEVSNTCGWLR